jgi:hypothetical protein
MADSGSDLTAQPGGQAAAHPDLSAVGPLQLTFISFVEPPGGLDEGGPHDAETSPGRQAEATEASKSEGGSSRADGSDRETATALFEVMPLKSTPANSSGWCSVPGWPLR